VLSTAEDEGVPFAPHCASGVAYRPILISVAFVTAHIKPTGNVNILYQHGFWSNGMTSCAGSYYQRMHCSVGNELRFTASSGKLYEVQASQLGDSLTKYALTISSAAAGVPVGRQRYAMSIPLRGRRLDIAHRGTARHRRRPQCRRR
jgi:hypothetical protein